MSDCPRLTFTKAHYLHLTEAVMVLLVAYVGIESARRIGAARAR